MQQASEAAARDAPIDAVALDIIYEAARAATDETGAEVAAEVMAAAGLLPSGAQPHASTAASSKQALASTTPRQRSTGSASPKMPSAAQPHTAQHSPKRPSPCMLVRRTRRAHEGFALPSCRWHHLCRRTSRTVG